MVISLDKEKGVEFLKNRILNWLNQVKDLLGPYRYRLFVAMVEECNDFDELRDMAELDLQMDLFDYVRDEIEPKLEELNLSLSDLRKLDSDVDYSKLAKPANLELEPDDIMDAMDDDEVNSAMAAVLTARLANEPIEEKYRQEILDFTYESDPEVACREIDDIDDAELAQYANAGAGEPDDMFEDDDESELEAYSDYDQQKDEDSDNQDDFDDSELLAYGDESGSEQEQESDEFEDFDDSELAGYSDDENSETDDESDDEDAELLAYCEDQLDESDDNFDDGEIDLSELEAYADYDPIVREEDKMSSDEIFLEDEDDSELEAYADSDAAMTEDEIFDDSMDELEAYADGDDGDSGDLDDGFIDDGDLEAYGDNDIDVSQYDMDGLEADGDNFDIDDDELAAYGEDNDEVDQDNSQDEQDDFDIDDDELAAYGESDNDDESSEDDDPFSEIDDAELAGLIDDSDEIFKDNKPNPKEAVKPTDSAKVHSKDKPLRSSNGVKYNTVFMNGTSRGDKTQKMFNAFVHIGFGSQKVAKQIKNGTSAGIEKVKNFRGFDFDGGADIDF